MAYKTFQNGYPLPASDLNNYLMNQSVIVFANSAARTTDIPTPIEGMVTYLEDTNAVEVWDGSAWQNINDNSNSVPLSTVAANGDLIVGDGASSVTNLTVGANGSLLYSDGTDPSWLTNSGTEGDVLAVNAIGGLGFVTPGQSANDIITTEGDLIIGDSSGDAVRLGIGTTGKVLTSDGTTASWETVDPGGNYTLITSGTVTSSTLSITSIPSGYDDLIFIFSGGELGQWRINGNTNAQYNASRITGGQDTINRNANATSFPSSSSGNYIKAILHAYRSSQPKIVTAFSVVGNEPVFAIMGNENTQVVSSIQSVSSVTGNYQLWGLDK